MKKVLMLLVAAMLLLPAGEAEAQLIGRKKRLEKEKQEAAAKAASSSAPRKKETAYDKLFKNKSEVTTAQSDFITLHKVKDKLYFEIPVKYLGREMLMASTLSEASSSGFGDIGYKAKAPMHIRFTMQDSTVHMRQVNAGITTDFMEKALRKVNQDPILFSYDIKAWSPDSSAVVVDMTQLFAGNTKQFDFFPDGMMGGMVKITPQFKKENSTLDEIKSFDDNLSVKSTLSFGVSAGMMTMKIVDDMPFTAKVTRSILLLPENKMTPRLSDSRVGVFNTGKTRFGSDHDGAKAYSVANRWRIIPKDVEAYKRGEMVEPTQKIIFYVDDTFPETWKEPIKKGIEHWNKGFEAIGFKNVVEARDFPTPEEDPDFDPDNLKYSCVRYVPSSTANAMGPSWVDPTTGEIINASVIVYSNIIELVNNWRFVQTSQLDPRVRTKKMPDDVVDESLQYIIAHEVGHCLGFMHNMASSAAWPVDSLRSATFTHKYGTTPCIMDYARHNYVAQPEDKGVKLTPPDIGVYDYFLVKWTYQYLPQFQNEWDEKATVESWVDATAGDPIYRYGRQQVSSRYDPSSIEEDLGNDPVKASNYGVKNLKYILPNLEQWIDDDPDYSHRQGLYSELLNQYYRYVRNVMLNIGGIYLTEVKEGTAGERITPVAKATQKASLRWVMNEYRNMGWVDNASLKRNFKLGVGGSYTLRDKVAKDFKAQISNVVLSSHYSNSPYTVQEFMNDIYAGTWDNLLTGRALTDGDKTLQQTMVAMFCEPLDDKKAAGSGGGLFGFAPSVDEIIAYRLDDSGLIERYADVFRKYEQENGHGSVAAQMCSGESHEFGPAGMGFQNKVNVGAIDDSNNYLTDLAVRSRSLLRNAVASSSGSARAHYQSLLIKLNTVLKDKL